MAEAMRPGTTIVMTTPDLVLTYPDLAAQMANVVANWSLVEQDLLVLYSIVMGMQEGKSLSDPTPNAHPLAWHVFDHIDSLSARMDLIHDLLEAATPDDAKKFDN